VTNKLDAKIPDGPIEKKWDQHRFDSKLVNPSNKRKYDVIVVGSGLAGASAAATLGELGYNVLVTTIHDTPRRAHSIAAQGGINAAKNYPGDGDSIYRLFYDTVKGGDFRSREANVYRLAQVSNEIIDQAVAQGVPFAREYGGLLDNRSFGGAQVSRTFYARGQTGQQLLLGAYSALMRQVDLGTVKIRNRIEMKDLVVVDDKARGIVCRNLITGEYESYSGHCVLLCTGGYGRTYYLSTNAMASNGSAAWRCHKKGAFFANPCFTQIHPTCIPRSGHYQSKLTLMSESLRNDGRVWVPKKVGDDRKAKDIPEDERDYYLERIYPSFGNLVPRDVASRQAKFRCDEGRGVGATKEAVFLDFEEPIARLGKDKIKERYGNLFQMYEKITDENPYEVPMRIFPAVHYTMGGLWVDYNLQSTIPGLFVLGEANFSDHGANRLGASALMQGLADGYYVAPVSVGKYLGESKLDPVDTKHEAFKASLDEITGQDEKLLNIQGEKTVDEIFKQLGSIMWEKCGMARKAEWLKEGIQGIQELREDFWQNVKVTGSKGHFNNDLEMAGRLADFLEVGELMCRDALERNESCGGHFREESKTEENEAKRDDENFQHVAAWEHVPGKEEVRHTEALSFEHVIPSQRSYK
jgi:succinate dehydrogenase / fumarate reductase flavoprotein subunit